MSNQVFGAARVVSPDANGTQTSAAHRGRASESHRRFSALFRVPPRSISGAAWLLVVVALTLVGCGSRQPTPDRPGSAAARPDSGLIIGVQGDAAVKRAGWRDYAPALFGAPLRRGDLLRLDASGRATVACPDLKLATVEGGVSGLPCQVAQRTPIVYEGSLLTPTRGDNATGDYPLVLSPRKTRLLNPQAVLRWQPVPGTTSYKVSLQGTTWTAEAADTNQLAYPAGAPALQPGTTYRLVVTAGGRSSNEEPGAGLGFSLLSADETKAVREAEAKIRALGLAETPTALLIANVYATNGLYAEAIEGLESLQAEEPAVLRLLGDLYTGIGLNRLAEERYTAALARSEALDDVEGRAQAHQALGRIYDAVGSPAEARRHLAEALALYDQLGDTAQATESKVQLDALPKP